MYWVNHLDIFTEIMRNYGKLGSKFIRNGYNWEEINFEKLKNSKDVVKIKNENLKLKHQGSCDTFTSEKYDEFKRKSKKIGLKEEGKTKFNQDSKKIENSHWKIKSTLIKKKRING